MKNKAIFITVVSILFTLIATNIVLAQFAGGVPNPGDIYKEFTFNNNSNNWRVTDPNMDLVKFPEGAAFLPNPKLSLSIDDLQGAIYAEVVIDFWGGHEGTIGKKFRFNGNNWIDVPELNTLGPCPYPGNKYMQQVNHLIEIPLGHLRQGTNIFEGTSGPNGWDWGQWGWYGVVLRVYYNSSKPHATGQITSPSPSSTISDNPTITATTSGSVSRVEFLACYDGYDTDGDGMYADFHRNYHRESWTEQINIKNHVGTATSAPYQVSWDTRWVPDQAAGQVKLIARIRDNNGCWYVTDEVKNLTLKRTDFSVKLYKPFGVPQKYWVRAGQIKYSKVNIPTLSTATAAVMHVATWNGNDGSDDFYNKINSWTAPKYGSNHFYSYDQITVPVSALKAGDNTITFSSSTSHHGIEIMWPGPAIFVRYGSAPPVSGTAPAITQQPSNTTVSVGQTATFSVSATGTAPLSYQWRKNGTNISGATGASYTTPQVILSDDGSTFSCRVSNAYGAVTSNNATLSVTSSGTAPAITQQPSSKTVSVGQTATFSVSATGTPPLSYQWRKNGTNISGATGSSYTTPPVGLSDDGSTFYCRVSNLYGAVTSNVATLTVTSSTPPPPATDTIVNPGFEDGTNCWKFFTSGSGDFAVSGPGYESSNAACVTTDTGGTNIQLYQCDLSLEPDTDYQLTFAAYSNTGHDCMVSMLKHAAPYTNYGLAYHNVNLTTGWNTYTINFTTSSFDSPVNDARLMFWFADTAT
ncbi:MAG: immunoglobulin domain-containing protein, partial [Pseudomonadota bacterium]